LLNIVTEDLDTIDAAFVVIESITRTVQANNLDQLRFQVRQIQEELQLLAKSTINDAQRKAVADELAAWMTVWLQNPAVFADWLALRRNSSEFLQKFA
jgi:hypothetical protein